MRIALLARDSAALDAIQDHTLRLADALRGCGVEVDVCFRRSDGSWVDEGGKPRAGLRTGFAGCDWIVLQYNPFLYGQRGFAPWLPLECWRLRMQRNRPRIALYVHETAMPLTTVRWALMGLWQRAQLRTLRPAADLVFASIELWANQLRRLRPTRPTIHVPGSSTLPDMRSMRNRQRQILDADEGTLVVATLTTGHPSQMLDLVTAAVRRLSDSAGRRLILLALGAGAREPENLPSTVEVVRPGALSPARLSAALAGADLFLAPFKDGVSTRRSSLMAALQHGLAIVGTQGRSTDSVLATSDAFMLVPARPEPFAEAVLTVASDPERRESLGRAAKSLYVSHFAWPVLARTVLYQMERHR